MAATSNTTLGTRRAVLAPSRRQLIGGSILAALSGAAFAGAVVLPDPGEAFPQPIGHDAEVLAACATFTTAHQQVERLEHADVPDAVFNAAVDALHAALVRVSGLRATTPTGLRAKADVCRAVLAMDEPEAADGRFNGPVRRHDVLAASFLADFLGGAVSLPVAPPAAASPDAELIGLCAECDALQARIDGLYAPRADYLSRAQEIAQEKARDIAMQPFADAQDPILERICDLRATTPQGHAARARTLLAWDKDPIWTDDGCWNSQLIGAIVRDAAGVA
jgi:hypothetical protein